MNTKHWRIVYAVLLMGLLVLGSSWIGLAETPTYTEEWDGRGTDSLAPEKIGEGPRTEDGWIHWVFSTKGASTDAKLVLGGTGFGEYEPGEPLTANTWHFYTPFFELDGLTATIYLFGGAPGPGGGLVISDYFPGGEEELTVSKTAVTSFEREHFWDIDKKVETDNGDEKDGYPKIWLDQFDNEQEAATWTVDVTYKGYEDTDFNVSGIVTIENTGSLPAVITDVTDVLGGTPIVVDFGVTFPHTLSIGEKLTGTYSEDGYFEGFNKVTVTTERDTYFTDAEIVWGEPATEVNKTVTIEDDSDLEEDVVTLGTVTAPNDGQFTYSNDFNFADYQRGSYAYENTATIVETGHYAKALLKVNVRIEELLVTKTAETSFEREHFWNIEKTVDPEDALFLTIDGEGDTKVTYTVTVEYLGFEDSGWNVSGTITIKNTGDLDAEITDVSDLLGGTAVDVDFGVEFPYTLAVDGKLIGTYSEDGFFEGFNEVTVTTKRDEYFADAEIIWGDPDKEINETVKVVDKSSLNDFEPVTLGTLTAPDGNSFTYDQDISYAMFGLEECGEIIITNKAELFAVDADGVAFALGFADAEVSITVYVQCFVYETAYAKGDGARTFQPDFRNWGWTNKLSPDTTETMPMYAGAGQNDITKGTYVGDAVVSYVDGAVTVVINLLPGLDLDEYHVYAGTTVFPQQTRGRRTVDTVAPGQYYIEDDLSGDIWVIVHGVVGLPDPNFGK